MSERLERLLDQDDERRDARCSKCHNVDAAKVVERLVRSEQNCRILEAELRSRIVAEEKHLAGNPDQTALLERIRELEGIVARQNDIITRKGRRAS